MTESFTPPTPSIAPVVPSQPASEPRNLQSAELFQGARVVEITHSGETYRLLLTRNNRLILQK
ncbi:hemin uptake protein HemP [Lacipirellula sp.]|uniref:hemin uptake protein HemP n=1 Tax=Lacipirellula sp. TaxID=2691419 RepID=UPI003D0EB78E